MFDCQCDSYCKVFSSQGVEQGCNYKEGVYDIGYGYGCIGKLKMQKFYGNFEILEDKIVGKVVDVIFMGVMSVIFGIIKFEMGYDMFLVFGNSGCKDDCKEDFGGLGGLIGVVGFFFSGVFGEDEKEKQSSWKEYFDGLVMCIEREYGYFGDKYGQVEYCEIKYFDGSCEVKYSQYEQRDLGCYISGWGYEEEMEMY